MMHMGMLNLGHKALHQRIEIKKRRYVRMHLDTIRRIYEKGTGPSGPGEKLMEALDILPDNVVSKSHLVGFYAIRGAQLCGYELKLLLEARSTFVSKLKQRALKII